MIKFRSKRGDEQPRVIVYVLFTTMLAIAGIYVAYTYMGEVNLTLEFSAYNLRYNSAASRLLNSADCYAADSSYDVTDYEGETFTYTQVSAGIIDWETFNRTDVISDACINNERQVYAKLTFLDTGVSHEVWTEPWEMIEVPITQRLLAANLTRRVPQKADKPTQEELADEDVWVQKAVKYYVLIKDEDKLEPGFLVVRLKA